MRFSEFLLAAATLGYASGQRVTITGPTTGGVQPRKNLNSLCSMDGPERYVDVVVTLTRGMRRMCSKIRDDLLTPGRQNGLLPSGSEDAG